MSKIALLHTTEEHKKKTIDKIILDSSPVPTYTLLLILSIVIVTIGLVLGSESIVIGGMLVSPLLSPIASLAMGVVVNDQKLITRSIYVLGKSVVVVFAISFLIALIVPVELNQEILGRTNASLMYLYIAIASGIAASFSYVKESFSERIIGVAVAIALLPPLSVTGIGLAILNKEIIFGSLELFASNFIGIFLSFVIVFSLFGFFTVRFEATKKLKEETENIKKYKKEKEDLKESMKDDM